MGELRLEVRDFSSTARWRWVLTKADGAFVADHEAHLDVRSWQYEAFSDLSWYLRSYAAPDRRIEDEARIVTEVGEWIGAQVLGPVAAAMVRERPAVVRVIVAANEPPEAQRLLFWPLELAHVGGKPLSVQDVTLVMHAGGHRGDFVPIGERLRVLGLFSLPEGGRPLNLRRERQALVELLQGVAARNRAVEVRVLQYGVTRDRLRSTLADDEGWDVIHVSGHGAPGELLLESPNGSPDPVTSGELAGLLDLARERVKLVTLSACWSAARVADQQQRLLGLSVRDRSEDPGVDQDDGSAAGALATDLTERLGCAVLAMRYPVTDDFAIGLAAKLYDLLVHKGRPLPQALGITMRHLVAVPPTVASPALLAGTSALFGSPAVNLQLEAPRRSGADYCGTVGLKMAGFPPQPDRFVGRTGLMARASAALAPESRIPGVLLYGMPGGGKTACAVELGYTHEHAFHRLIWYKAPDDGQDITGALTNFVLILERELPGFQMMHVLADGAKLAAFLPRLTEMADRRRVLIVIDSIESLLSQAGQWRDARWGQVLNALASHTGMGRVVLTSRRRPVDIAGLQVLAVDALSLDEALLLAKELPHLRDLLSGELPGVDWEMARRLALGVLNVAQGHPKLLELADGQAAESGRLAALVRVGDQAWRESGGLPDGFFRTGESQAPAENYLNVLAAWTDAASDGLTNAQRILFWFLCCLEEADRVRGVLLCTRADLRERLQLNDEPLDLDDGVAALATRGLVTIRPETADAKMAYGVVLGASYGIHPGVAAAGRAQAGERFRDAVDTELSEFWEERAMDALRTEEKAPTTGQVVHAGLAAAPYLMRQGQFDLAAELLWAVFDRHRSRATAAAVLPGLQTVASAGKGPRVAEALAQVMKEVDPAATDPNVRLAVALALADKQIEDVKERRLGPWSELAAAAERLRVLNDMGQAEYVLAEVERLRAQMQALPPTLDSPEAVFPWDAREALLNAGCLAAAQLGRWPSALEFNLGVVTSMRDRGAPAVEIARMRFNAYGPLIDLGRIEEALALLLDCRQVFESARELKDLAATIGAIAEVEASRGHGDTSITLMRDALRYSYIAGDVVSIATSHHNLGSFLYRYRQSANALAHHLAAALVCVLAGAGGVDRSVNAAIRDLRESSGEGALPADVADLCHQVSQIQGAALNRLLTTLTSDVRTPAQAFRDLTAYVRAQVTVSSPAVTSSRSPWRLRRRRHR